MFIWIQETVSAPPHSTQPVMLYVSETVLGGWIGCFDPINWPLTSPGLTPLDFCLWGWVKSEAYK
jgi:hypothetical protein